MFDLDTLTSEELFEEAKGCLEKGDRLGFHLCKSELESREFMGRFHKALGRTEKDELLRDIRKAILTKPSEEREEQPKKAKDKPKAKLGLNAKGRTYQYDESNKKPPSLSNPKEAPEGEEGEGEEAAEGPPKMAPLNPETFAHLLKTTTGALKKVAEEKGEEGFINWIKDKGRKLIKKRKIPDEYWPQLYSALEPETKKSFSIDFRVYGPGEERDVARALVKSKVTSMGELATFVRSNFGLDPEEATEAAQELHKALLEDGAIKETV